jgi:lipopolysaccharide transport system ATP-binding protein
LNKNIAIRVENLSKRYRIGLEEETQDTFVGTIGSIFNSPFQNFKKLKKLTTFKSDNKKYDDVIWALKDVSFEVKKGEVIGIIGANGAGKSTLLKILSKITHPTSGRVELNGRVASLLEVGTGFHPELTGRENIYLNGTILGMTKKEIDFKLDEIIEFSGVEKFIDTPVKKYSSGMRVRLAFSVAAHLDPEILLIDEVLAVGDAEFQKKCLGKMDNISKQGRTILFVSHNLISIQMLCKRCILIKKGRMELQDSTERVIDKYFSNYKIKINDSISLKTHEGRTNSNYIIFEMISVSEINKELDKIRIGDSLEIGIEVNLTNIKYNLTGLGISIENIFDQRIILYCPTYQGYDLTELPKKRNKIICKIPATYLTPGHYYISLIASSQENILDKVSKATSFYVYPQDIFHSGKIPRQKDGYFFQNVNWDLPTRIR